jgi:hypothetical protein
MGMGGSHLEQADVRSGDALSFRNISASRIEGETVPAGWRRSGTIKAQLSSPHAVLMKRNCRARAQNGCSCPALQYREPPPGRMRTRALP